MKLIYLQSPTWRDLLNKLCAIHMTECYEVIKNHIFKPYVILREDAQGIKSSGNKENKYCIERTCDKFHNSSLPSYICPRFNPFPTLCCFCPTLPSSGCLCSSPGTSPLCWALPLCRHLYPPLASSLSSQNYHQCTESSSTKAWSGLSNSRISTWNIQKKRRVHWFTGPNMGSREVYVDYRHDQSQDGDCPPNPPHSISQPYFFRCVDSFLSC